MHPAYAVNVTNTDTQMLIKMEAKLDPPHLRSRNSYISCEKEAGPDIWPV